MPMAGSSLQPPIHFLPKRAVYCYRLRQLLPPVPCPLPHLPNTRLKTSIMAARVLQTVRYARRGLLLRAGPFKEQAISVAEQQSKAVGPAGGNCCLSRGVYYRRCC